jgi:hypothetical protein
MTQVSPVLLDQIPVPENLYANLKPVRYRYVMAYLHDTLDPDGKTMHLRGEVMAVLPMTTVSYTIGLYVGTEMSGSVYLPKFYLDLMPHQPLQDFERHVHPDQGMPLGSLFECGNRAIYVMRNEEVVWGGILWSRSYTSGTPSIAITALSWEGYAYYRLLRQTVSFTKDINLYAIWYALLKQMLTDFSWDSPGKDGRVTDATTHPNGDPKKSASVMWTGLTRKSAPSKPAEFNVPARDYIERWPENSPDIELPPQNLKWLGADNKEILGTKTWHGYDMGVVGGALEEWADTETITSVGGGKRFEYRVVCWFDNSQQRFRQRYVFGEMHYAPTSTHDEPKPDGLTNNLLGKNTADEVLKDTNQLVFDFPGHISNWSLSETMDEAATRVLVTSNEDAAAKHVAYDSDEKLLLVPGTGAEKSKQGWRLYDQVNSYSLTNTDTILTKLADRALKLLNLFHVPQAGQINDLAAANTETGQVTSIRATSFQVSLYQEPTTPFPVFGIGDWAMFAIADPFYGGVMYLKRRIIGYTVTVTSDHESDYSHEQIELELTDDSKVELGE